MKNSLRRKIDTFLFDWEQRKSHLPFQSWQDNESISAKASVST